VQDDRERRIEKISDFTNVIVNLGEVEVLEDITPKQREQLRPPLLKSGLELMEDKKAMLMRR